jgi:hypothetical protein
MGIRPPPDVMNQTYISIHGLTIILQFDTSATMSELYGLLMDGPAQKWQAEMSDAGSTGWRKQSSRHKPN